MEVHSNVPNRFQRGMKLWSLENNGERRELTIEDLWPHKNLLVLKFAAVETISDAETLKGAELQVPRAERAELAPGWTYLSDLIGCTVFDREREIGIIADIAFGAGEAPLLVVRGVGEAEQSAKLPFEIPFAEAYLDKIDIAQKQVRMHLPEGLLDVNAPLKKDEKEKS